MLLQTLAVRVGPLRVKLTSDETRNAHTNQITTRRRNTHFNCSQYKDNIAVWFSSEWVWGTVPPERVALSCSKTCRQHGSFLMSVLWPCPHLPPALLIWLAGSDLIWVKSRASENLIHCNKNCCPGYLTLYVHAGFESGRWWHQVFCLMILMMYFDNTLFCCLHVISIWGHRCKTGKHSPFTGRKWQDIVLVARFVDRKASSYR